MNCSSLSKMVSFLLAVFILVFAVPSLPVGSAETPALNIAQVTLTEDELAAGGTVAVDVTISGNSEGFLATSFGITYDTALTFMYAETSGAAGMAHSYSHNPEKGLLWFSGAAGSADSTANTLPEETMFTLHFTLPEDAAVTSSYPIRFCWTTADGSQGYWHVGDRSNIIGNMQSIAKNGSISIPDPLAPKLSETALRISTGDTAALSLLNYEGTATWISDNMQVAAVENGTVTGISAGSCNIYALVNGTSLTCTVTVTEEAYYDISATEVIYIRDPDKVIWLQYPNAAESQVISWISDNPSVVSVSNGLVKGLQNGAATVYAISEGTVYQVIVIVEFPEDGYSGHGDVNLDGDIDVLDVIMLNKNLLGGVSLNDEQTDAADAFNDSLIDSTDSLCIMKHIIGLLETIPVAPDTTL